MISDVLSQASIDISDYLDRQPEVYAQWKDRLETLVAEMNAIRSELDAPPIPSDENIAALESAVSDKIGRNVRIYFGDAPMSNIDEIYTAATRDATRAATRDATRAATRPFDSQ